MCALLGGAFCLFVGPLHGTIGPPVADDMLSIPTLDHVEHIDHEGVRVGSLAR